MADDGWLQGWPLVALARQWYTVLDLVHVHEPNWTMAGPNRPLQAMADRGRPGRLW